MKTKLWVMWGVLGATAVLAGILGADRSWVYGFAVVAAAAGWVAFLLPNRS